MSCFHFKILFPLRQCQLQLLNILPSMGYKYTVFFDMSWDYLRTLALVVKRKIWPLSFKITLLHFKAAVLSFLYLT